AGDEARQQLPVPFRWGQGARGREACLPTSGGTPGSKAVLCRLSFARTTLIEQSPIPHSLVPEILHNTPAIKPAGGPVSSVLGVRPTTRRGKVRQPCSRPSPVRLPSA